jgi:hypothetical protein
MGRGQTTEGGRAKGSEKNRGVLRVDSTPVATNELRMVLVCYEHEE